jgi:hypothetical protein
MKHFEARDVDEAQDFAAAGGRGLHTHANDGDTPSDDLAGPDAGGGPDPRGFGRRRRLTAWPAAVATPLPDPQSSESLDK